MARFDPTPIRQEPRFEDRLAQVLEFARARRQDKLNEELNRTRIAQTDRQLDASERAANRLEGEQDARFFEAGFRTPSNVERVGITEQDPGIFEGARLRPDTRGDLAAQLGAFAQPREEKPLALPGAFVAGQFIKRPVFRAPSPVPDIGVSEVDPRIERTAVGTHPFFDPERSPEGRQETRRETDLARAIEMLRGSPDEGVRSNAELLAEFPQLAPFVLDYRREAEADDRLDINEFTDEELLGMGFPQGALAGFRKLRVNPNTFFNMAPSLRGGGGAGGTERGIAIGFGQGRDRADAILDFTLDAQHPFLTMSEEDFERFDIPAAWKDAIDLTRQEGTGRFVIPLDPFDRDEMAEAIARGVASPSAFRDHYEGVMRALEQVAREQGSVEREEGGLSNPLKLFGGLMRGLFDPANRNPAGNPARKRRNIIREGARQNRTPAQIKQDVLGLGSGVVDDEAGREVNALILSLTEQLGRAPRDDEWIPIARSRGLLR
jgi:hypothetical protein